MVISTAKPAPTGDFLICGKLIRSIIFWSKLDLLQKYSFFLFFLFKRDFFLLARKGRTRDFILTRNLKYLNTAGQWPVRITMGCTAAGLTRCRLRTSCYDKLYFLYRIRFLNFFPLRRLCIIF